jgi:hypothetical protein
MTPRNALTELGVLESALALLERERAKIPWWNFRRRYQVARMVDLLERAIDRLERALTGQP